ncbi:MAG: LacI family transcriptional regulator [Clostridiales Family XIII bacterium]|jgi:LacI family transcriptional regulator|nr:LacI family transcriptional regulator [Clostridiales Family XIII bacterium]
MPIEKAITMKDVAERAGVTQSTVSHVFNGTATISEAVTQKVRAAAEELCYKPRHRPVGRLNGKPIRAIGLIVPDIENNFYAEFVRKTEALARQRDYLTILCNTESKVGLERNCIEQMAVSGVAGILLAYELMSPESYRALAKTRIPAVAMDTYAKTDTWEFPSISVNNLLGGRLAAEHLVKLGRKNAAITSAVLNAGATAMRERIKGFRMAMEEYGYPVAEENIFIESHPYGSMEGGSNIGAKVLVDGSIDAIFATNDYTAFGVMKRLCAHGLRIPSDIAIIGYDDVTFSGFVEPSLTTVAQPIGRLSETGMELLFSAIKNGNEAVREHIVVDPNLVIRDSTLSNAE